MTFIHEDVTDGGPTELLNEHRGLVAWMRANGVGVIDYLRTRMVDRDVSAALYYIQGIGMGDGQRFALVRGDDIYLVSVIRSIGRSSAEAFPARVTEVSQPEFAALGRGAIEELLANALHDFYEANPFMLYMGSLHDTGKGSFDWTGARWVVRPGKNSLLYWRTHAAMRWLEFRSRLWPLIWGSASSPLAAALALAGFALTGGGWTSALAGAWLALRLLQYDSEWHIGLWMLGRVKFLNPYSVLQRTARLMDPQPLGALKVRLERVDGEPMVRVVRVTNQSFMPVPYISINSLSLAKLLAPGLIEAMRRKARGGAMDSKELERQFPDMVKKWLWPGQTFTRRHQLLMDFPLVTHVRETEAVVAISRFVSGEPRSGPTTFLLEVEEARPDR